MKEKIEKHILSHAYRGEDELKFKCVECEFWGPNTLTLEVHVKKVHCEKIKCRLCDIETKDLESLEIHLTTCESSCAIKVLLLWETLRYILPKNMEKKIPELFTLNLKEISQNILKQRTTCQRSFSAKSKLVTELKRSLAKKDSTVYQ